MGLAQDLLGLFEQSKSTISPNLASILTIPVAVALVAVYVVAVITYRILFHPLRRLPGPFLAKFTGLWRDKKLFEGNWHDEVLRLHEKYGRVVRIAPNEVAVVDEHAMKQLYGHGHNAPKTGWYSVWNPPNTAPQLFSELDKKIHSFLRRRVAGAYSMTSVLQYEQYIQSCLDLLLAKLKRHAEMSGTADMSVWTNAFAFDTVGELGYGEKLGHLETETDVGGLRKAIIDIFALLSNMGYFPGQAWIINGPIQTVAQYFGAGGAFLWFRGWSAQQVKSRLDNINDVKRQDLLSHFCKMKKEDGSPAEFNEILIEVMNLIGAGADTTSIGMRACLYYVTKHPKVYKRLQEEIDKFYEERKLDRPISYLETQQVPYLQAVVKESIRMFPSIMFQLPRVAPENFEVRGFAIPAGTSVGTSPRAQNRDKDIWGDNANDFEPERWLVDEARTKYYDSSTMTFGGNGPRMCVGRNIALVELHKFLAQFIHNFDFEPVDPDKPWSVTTYWFAYQSNQNMKIRFRPNRVLREATDTQ